MNFSFNISNIFKESPTDGRSTAASAESGPGKVATTQPVAESDPAEDAGTRIIWECYALDFGDGLVLPCIPRNLRAFTGSDRGTGAPTGFSGVAYALCRLRGVV